MPRAPFQVLVFPFRPAMTDGWEYAIFQRTSDGWWQGISGGGEDDESPILAARRECSEEAGIAPESRFIPLDTTTSIKVTWFAEFEQWSEHHPHVIPEHTFGVACSHDAEFMLSDEHASYRWLPFADAEAQLRFDSNRTALWELDRRIRGLPAVER